MNSKLAILQVNTLDVGGGAEEALCFQHLAEVFQARRLRATTHEDSRVLEGAVGVVGDEAVAVVAGVLEGLAGDRGADLVGGEIGDRHRRLVGGGGGAVVGDAHTLGAGAGGERQHECGGCQGADESGVQDVLSSERWPHVPQAAGAFKSFGTAGREAGPGQGCGGTAGRPPSCG